MRPHKHSDAKAAAKQHEITPGRVSHSPSEQQVRDAKHDPHKSYTGGGPKVGKHGK